MARQELVGTPAGRLHNILFDVSATVNKGDAELFKWADVLGCDRKNTRAVFERYLNLVELPDQCRKTIEAIDDLEHADYLSWVGTIRKVLDPLTFPGNIAKVAAAAKPDAMSLIKICHDQIRRNSPDPEPEVAESGIEALQQHVIELAAEIANAGLDDALRNFMLRHVAIVEAAIADYRTMGAEGLILGVERTVGLVRVRRPLYDRAVTSASATKFMAVLGGLAFLVDTMQRGEYLADKTQWLLPESSEVVESKQANPSDKNDVTADHQALAQDTDTEE